MRYVFKDADWVQNIICGLPFITFEFVYCNQVKIKWNIFPQSLIFYLVLNKLKIS